MALQEYRDKEEKDWHKEREARERVTTMLSNEVKNSYDTVIAQERALEYSRQEKLAYHKILKKFQEDGKLNTNDIEIMLHEYQIILNELMSLSLAKE